MQCNIIIPHHRAAMLIIILTAKDGYHLVVLCLYCRVNCLRSCLPSNHAISELRLILPLIYVVASSSSMMSQLSRQQ
uniref:Uncharacterized protein n=1 Tax=Arundo donax TaxID=35708 RepID=A0A0A9CPQ5_ARUDO